MTLVYPVIRNIDALLVVPQFAVERPIGLRFPFADFAGVEAERAGWEHLFAGDTPLKFQLDEIVVIETVGLAMQSAVEHVAAGTDGGERGMALCTNVFLRTPSGWRMVMHHASPAPARSAAEPKGALH